MTRLLFLCGLVVYCQALGANWYAAPNADNTGNGSLARPWPLLTAMAKSSPIQPGDALWLLGGTYGVGTNIYYCYLVGTSNLPIVIRAAPNQRAIINGNIFCGGAANWTTFRDFEMTCSNARSNVYANRPAGLILSNQGHKAINLVLYNTGHPAIMGGGSEIYGCVIWGAGIYETDSLQHPTNQWVRGAGLYLQNKGDYDYIVSDNICSRNFTSGMKAYAENGYVERFVFDGNIAFKNNGSGIEIDCLYHSITNGTVINNICYRNPKNPMGYFDSAALAQHYRLIYSNNYSVSSPGPGCSSIWFKRWQDLTVLGNTVVTTSQTNEWSAGSGVGLGMGGNFLELFPGTNAICSYTINSNAYYGGVQQSSGWYEWSKVDGTNRYGPFYHNYQPFRYGADVSPTDGTNGLLSFSYWTNVHGFDHNSTYTTNLPPANVVILRTNKYEIGRANLAVFNWESNNTVNVDISSVGLTQGQGFEVRDVQNYLGTPVLATNYDAAHSTIVIPLTMTNISEVTGGVEANYTFNPNIHTASLFNVFVIRPLQSGGGLTPPPGFRVVP